MALLVGSGGLLVVALPGGGGSGALLSLLAAAAVTAGTLMVRTVGGLDVVVTSAAHFLVGGLVLAGAAFAAEGPPRNLVDSPVVIVLASLGLVATAATTLAWFVEAQRSALSSLTMWMFLIPVFGLLIGIVVLGERPGAWTGVGVALVLVAMWMALTSQPVPAGPPGVLCAACHLDAAVAEETQ